MYILISLEPLNVGGYEQPSHVRSISLQPGNCIGDVFVLACSEINILRLFDARTRVDGIRNSS